LFRCASRLETGRSLRQLRRRDAGPCRGAPRPPAQIRRRVSRARLPRSKREEPQKSRLTAGLGWADGPHAACRARECGQSGALARALPVGACRRAVLDRAEPVGRRPSRARAPGVERSLARRRDRDVRRPFQTARARRRRAPPRRDRRAARPDRPARARRSAPKRLDAVGALRRLRRRAFVRPRRARGRARRPGRARGRSRGALRRVPRGARSPPALEHLERSLFSDERDPDERGVALDGALRFFEGAGRRGVLERVAEELLALIRSGTPPEEIALVCPRVERYRAPLETALGSLG